MIKSTPLPNIMVAPNGARRTKTDHPSIPMTRQEIVDTAIACTDAGADGIHLHIRDAEGHHLLDADEYARTLEAIHDVLPELYAQVTSEAAGAYSAIEQQAMMRDLKPDHVSVGMREMVREQSDWPRATGFYEWALEAGVQIQHIVYSSTELQSFLQAVQEGRLPGQHFQLQFVLGNYAGTEISRPENVTHFTDILRSAPASLSFDWMLCAFGKEETQCLATAAAQGGKVRVGFENSLWNEDGRSAKDNAERVRIVRNAIDANAP